MSGLPSELIVDLGLILISQDCSFIMGCTDWIAGTAQESLGSQSDYKAQRSC